MTNGFDNLIRIGVFYDGNYFSGVSNYYNYQHSLRRRISIRGLHSFIKQQVAESLGTPASLSHIVDAHYFRGRLPAQEAAQKGKLLYYERLFDDILMSEGVTTHYLPLKETFYKKVEKGLDVWLALEAFEMAVYKKFSVVVLLAGDGDYVPLVRKLNTLGVRVMVLGWDYEYTDDENNRYQHRVSRELLTEATYPVRMTELINDRRNDEDFLSQLFLQKSRAETQERTYHTDAEEVEEEEVYEDEELHSSYVFSLKDGFGFIKHPPNNLFFHYTNLQDCNFEDLRPGDPVRFVIGEKEDGQEYAVRVYRN
ncbi:'Cold-shock' DNA-binding domain-containing protein [Cnuella takakiae]|uniref:'Cold-shock' DNA-binding domain-containing protein n=1 Tax=Cnuella takakiae TaxID=1302690 RepID=A0A1M5ES62_9BACT|nr:NYN domain-containing protein [Cnuella takakiae]OLY91281.1 cold-shock protein [Cnuella takakiae]SHF82059.1 'Cold-shock' DNA-binding domain-containing protein [Cnuella takakiae]